MARLYDEAYRPQFNFTARQWEGHTLNVGHGADGWGAPGVPCLAR